MEFLDYVVLACYFAVMIGIGVFTSMRIKKQEDYFMGGRGFGKLLQTFAAFGAGTGSADPVNTGRTTFTSGMSGMWSVMYWLFVTPFYWITGVWYRRMRHLTLGDWFVERYESKAMGLGYALFGIGFFIVYGSMMFSAIGKVAAPLVGFEAITLDSREAEIKSWTVEKKEIDAIADPAERDTKLLALGKMPEPSTLNIEYILVPIIGLVVLAYGIAGGLEAAYYTDLIQGLCIIVLSIILIPFGLYQLVATFGDPSTQSLFAGFGIMHEQLPENYFDVVGSTTGSEFPWYRILAIVIINLVGIVVQPHFIATGGGSAKTETNARVGLVVGNFLKRFCTVGWVLTALIALALFADSPILNEDPDKTWGVASKTLLPVGLTGLMLACLLAALMSSADAYMVVGSALVVRNIYAPYIKKDATEKQYVLVGRITGGVIILGAVLFSLTIMDVFEQLQITWVFGVLFAAPFWVGMYWRKATPTAAWATVAFCAIVFFLVPYLAPRLFPALRTNEMFLATNEFAVTTVEREAAPSDLAKRRAWKRRAENVLNLSDAAKEQSTADQNAAILTALSKLGTPKPEVVAADENDEWRTNFEKIEKDAAMLTGLASEHAPPNDETWMSLYNAALAVKDADKLQDTLKAVVTALPGTTPEEAGVLIKETSSTGGDSIFWGSGVAIVNAKGENAAAARQPDGKPLVDGNVSTQKFKYDGKQLTDAGLHVEGRGNLKLDFLLYRLVGVPLESMSGAMLDTLTLPIKIISPFLVMILLSLVTRKNTKEGLDRYYSKMKTPVDPDPTKDKANLAVSFKDVDALEAKKLFPGSSLEIQKPTMTDILGFVICFIVCFAIIGLAVLVANIGG